MKAYLQLFMNKTPTLYHTAQGKGWLLVMVLVAVIVLITSNAMLEQSEHGNPIDILDILVLGAFILLGVKSYHFSRSDHYVAAKDVHYRTAVISQAHREYPCVVAFKSRNSSGESVTRYYLTKQYPQLGKTSTFHAYQLQVKHQSDDSVNETKQDQVAKIKDCSVKALPLNAKQGSVKDSATYLEHELKEHTNWMKKSTN